jgi:hypothetical protein
MHFPLNVEKTKCMLAVPWLRRLVATSHRGDPGSILVQSMWDLWWTKWHWDRFFPRVLRFYPVNFIPPVLHYTEKRKRKLIIFITGLHNKPEGCGASVASAAGPFTIHTKNVRTYISSTEWYLLHPLKTMQSWNIWERHWQHSVAKLRAGLTRNCCSIPGSARDFSLFQNDQVVNWIVGMANKA